MESGQRRHHRAARGPNEELFTSLQPDQLELAMLQPVPRRELGVWVESAMLALRVIVLGLTGLVGYTFVASMVHGW